MGIWAGDPVETGAECWIFDRFPSPTNSNEVFGSHSAKHSTPEAAAPEATVRPPSDARGSRDLRGAHRSAPLLGPKTWGATREGVSFLEWRCGLSPAEGDRKLQGVSWVKRKGSIIFGRTISVAVRAGNERNRSA